jgi:hypothetical protein
MNIQKNIKQKKLLRNKIKRNKAAAAAKNLTATIKKRKDNRLHPHLHHLDNT